MGNSCRGSSETSFIYKTHRNVPQTVRYVTIDPSVRTIPCGAFLYCSNLLSVEFHEAVEIIEEDAFHGCTALTYVRIPHSVTNIGHRAFYKCTNLAVIDIDSSPSSLSLSTISLPAPAPVSLSAPPSRASSYRSTTATNTATATNAPLLMATVATPTPPAPSHSQTSLTLTARMARLGEGLSIIGEEAFLECSSLTSISIPPSLTKLSKYAFFGCTALASIDIHQLATIPSIKPCTFANCISLRSITLPSHVLSIERNAFENCTSLQQVLFTPNNRLRAIEKGAFHKCKSLTHIEIPPSVTNLDMTAFQYCTSLQYVKIPSNTSIQNKSTGAFAFNNCTSLKAIALPLSITTIGMYAFNNCTSLVSIQVPSNLRAVEQGAFANCRSLMNILLPRHSIRSFANQTFRNCTVLRSAYNASRDGNGNGSQGQGQGQLEPVDKFQSWILHRFEEHPIHQMCYYYQYDESIVSNSTFDAMQVDVQDYILQNPTKVEVTALHVALCNPFMSMDVIRLLLPLSSKLSTSIHAQTQHVHDDAYAVRGVLAPTATATISATTNATTSQNQNPPGSVYDSIHHMTLLQLYMTCRGLNYISIEDALKLNMPWMFLQELLYTQSSFDELRATISMPCQNLYPFMIAAIKGNGYDLEIVYNLALLTGIIF